MSPAKRLLPAGLSVSDAQIDLLDAYGRELRRMNQRINLVSSETESEFWKRHTAHCLALATSSFPDGARIVDWGTGGGLPAIPLAIMFPTCEVVGVDAVRKKVQSCTAIARRLGLDNCTFVHGRAEQVSLTTDYSVSRATAPLATLWGWHERVVRPGTGQATLPDGDVWPRGLICLKGGDLSAEINELRDTAISRSGAPTVQTLALTDLFDDPWFEEKVIICVA